METEDSSIDLNNEIESMMQLIGQAHNQLLWASVLALCFFIASQIVLFGSLFIVLIRLKWFKPRDSVADVNV
jgi:heme/copper-type cytochrome/quinol oxidase subunit 3